MNLADKTYVCALAVGLQPEKTSGRGVICGEYRYCPADELEQAANLYLRFHLSSAWSEKADAWELRDPLFPAPPVVNPNWNEAVVDCVARMLTA